MLDKLYNKYYNISIMKTVNIRKIQHNFSRYVDIAKLEPLIITRYGKKEVIMLSAENYSAVKKIPKTKNIMESKFIGMYKNKKSWAKKSTKEIANSLRKKAWYGE
ncbi:hypothetical protein COV24_00010 [candidate division WWE3 bacterium CG10_big_fil_rev_8_21_14_0_10_32_10]|uniref:Antitoxin n=1 Tax=candidate division WWE3 bacterium CG10_big_fil_rev_8_21_14_0_10_32_10 TaxID=1975090 RepID=A0A2H0RD11_UNCKA|nr:MAG: hypothetical protein COV24_00010 [candidate division WWE3 bacterium CG10_big_fil_rev_8_21_14_0_10_32_10]